MNIAVLAVQGAFIEHEHMLASLGVPCLEIREKRDLGAPFDGLILPGGESTAMGSLLRDLELFEPLRERIAGGRGSRHLCGPYPARPEVQGGETHFATLPAAVSRNAFGRQLGSSAAEGELEGRGAYPMVFIRAPRITGVLEGGEVFARAGGEPVGVRCGRQFGVTFHPELTGDPRVHQIFLESINNKQE